MAASAGCIDKTLMKPAGMMLFLLHKWGQRVRGAADAHQSGTVGGASVSLCCKSHLNAYAAAVAPCRAPCIMGD